MRLTRRRVLATTGASTLAVALLAACGGGTSEKAQRETAAKVQTISSDKAEGPVKRGGTLQMAAAGDPPSLDPYRSMSLLTLNGVAAFTYSRLMRYETGPGADPNKPKSRGDLAQAFEVGPDGMTYTFKLRAGVKFHNLTPVNGREVDAQDVVESHKRFVAMAPQASTIKQLVADVSAPDTKTVVYKLNTPNANFVNTMSSALLFWVLPKEQTGTWDPQKQPIGTGPWTLSNYTASSRMEFKRNPDFYEKDIPNLDGVTAFIMPETATRLAQFRAGSLYTHTPSLVSDFTDLYGANNSLRVVKGDVSPTGGGIGFGRNDPNAPWIKDDRVRKAVSLSLDRTAVIEAINDYDNWKKIGLEREYRLANFVPAGDLRWWTDPRGKEMGDTAKWFAYDPAEGKKFLAAAGFPNGLDIEFHFSSNAVPPPYQDSVALLGQQVASVGIRAKMVPEDYATVWNPKTWGGDFTGITYGNWQVFGDPDLSLDYLFGKGTRNHMKVDDPEFNRLYALQAVERDEQKRRAILIDMYKHLANDMRHVPITTQSIASYSLSQPSVRNEYAYRTGPNALGGETLPYMWLAS